MNATILQVNKEDLRCELKGIFNEMLEKAEQQAAAKANDALLTSGEVCQRLKVSNVTLWRWGRSGYLTSVNIGGKVRFRTSDVMGIIEKGR